MGHFPARVDLGRTGLSASPIGLGSSYGIGERGVLTAFDRGINYFYWGTRRSPSFGRGLAALCARERDALVVVVQTYTRVAALMRPSLERALRELRIERADVLLLGWWNRPIAARVREAARALEERGLARALMVSCHHRPNFAHLAADPGIDALMVRYNAAHPGAERDVFPHLPNGCGVVAYTATSWGHLLDPERIPDGERIPTAADCYRFALTNPAVDIVLCGPRDEAELEGALRALERGPMDGAELAWIRRAGAAVRAREKAPLPWLFALRRPRRAQHGARRDA